MNKYIILILVISFLIIIFCRKNEKMSDTKPYLWQYWDTLEDKPTPEYIKLCFDSVNKHCSKDFNIVRLNKDNIIDYIPEIKKYQDKLDKLIIAQKVDIYRIFLLLNYGGLYIDADTIVLKNPIEIMKHLRKYDYVGFGCTGYICKYGYGGPSNGIMAANKDSILMKNVLNHLLNKINTQTNFDYFDLGKLVIWNELEKLFENNYEYYHYPNTVDGTRDIDGKWVTSQRIFSNEKINYDDEKNMLFLILYNSEIDNQFKNMSKTELLNSDTNFSKFIKKALF